MSAMSDFLEAGLRSALFRTKTVTARANSTAYALGDLMMLGTSDLTLYEATTAGTSAGSAPGFTTTLGATTTDGTVVWTACRVGYPKRGLRIALYTAAPSDAGGGTEVSGGSYARQSYDPADANWTAASGTDGLTDNASQISFPVATANWGTITHLAVLDPAGNFLLWGALAASKTINTGDQFVLPAGQLDITLA